MEPLMTSDFKLPLVGLGTYYYEFSKEDPDAGVRRHRSSSATGVPTRKSPTSCTFRGAG